MTVFARFVTVAAIAATSMAPVFAQSAITGLVTDPAGSAVPSAVVAAVNTATGVRAETVSSGTGNYVIPNLAIGTYALTVSVSGFKTWMRPGIVLFSNDSIRIDAALEVGQLSEKIQVTAAAPTLKSESTDVSTTIEAKLVKDLPVPIGGVLGGVRSAFNLMMMLPQVRSQDGQSTFDDFQVGGGQMQDFAINVDGLNVESGARTHPAYAGRMLPPVDSIAEFRLDTSGFKAEDGHVSGGNIVIVTKSGTNGLHGGAFEYYRSQVLDANTWGNNKFGRPKAPYHRNDFGFDVGGPVRFPKLYNGRDKTYFYISMEAFRQPMNAAFNQLTLPTAIEKNGNFSDWVQANGALIPIYDPNTTRTAGGQTVRDIFPGNMIPANRISPISRKINAYIPDPNGSGLVRNYDVPGTRPEKRVDNTWLLKFDQSFGVKNRLAYTQTHTGSYRRGPYDLPVEKRFDPLVWGGAGLGFPLTNDQRAKGDPYFGSVWRINDTHTITPTLINTGSFGINRIYKFLHGVTSDPLGQNWGDKLGGIGNNPYYNYNFPSVAFSTDNYYGWSTGVNQNENYTTWEGKDDLAWIKGSHSIKGGFSYAKLMTNGDGATNAGGNFSFHRLETALPADNSGRTGNAFASFLLGATHGGSFAVPNANERRWSSWAFYIQDDWKVTRRLTANFGLRYELNKAVVEKHDRITYMDPYLPNPAADGYPGALVFMGKGPGRTGKRTFYDDPKGWGPRAGLAFQLTHNTVIRAGGGIFFSPSRLDPDNTGFTAIPSFSSPDSGITPAFYWDNGFPAWQAPPFLSPSFNTGLSGSFYDFVDGLATNPSSASWNFAISHVLPKSFVLDATYTGTKGTHLATDKDNYMQINPRYAYLGNLLLRPIDDPAVVALGFRPPFPSFKALMQGNATLGQALRLFPQYTSLRVGQDRVGNSNYNALIVGVTKRFSDGLSMNANYVWSKQLTDTDASTRGITNLIGSAVGGGSSQDNFNRRLEKSYGVIDTPHSFKLTGSYDLPFGRGKKLVQGRVLDRIVGGWTLASYMYAQSGFPMGVVDSGFDNFLKGGQARPNVTSNFWTAPSKGDEFDPDKDVFFLTSAFVRRTNPSIDPIGNAPRYSGETRYWGLFRTNLALSKAFRVAERMNFVLRGEAYDAFNQKRWGQPDSKDLANSQFGKVTTAGGSRSMQLSLKLVF